MSAMSIHILWIISLSFSIIQAKIDSMPQLGCSYEYTPMWQPLQERKRTSHTFSNRQIIAGKISLSKKCNKRVELSQFKVRWIPHSDQQGTIIEKLQSALYKKCPLVGVHHNSPLGNVVCTERYHIADGQWSKKEKTLIFRFEPFSLNIDTVLYLVLTIPDDIEQQLKDGEFIVEQIYLPEEFQL